MFYFLDGNKSLNIVARKTAKGYRFLFDPASIAPFPSFLRSVANVYQSGEEFYESMVQINLKEITLKPIMDVWVSVVAEHLTLHLLTESACPNVDLVSYSIRETQREVFKVTLTRPKLAAISRRREVFCEPEPCLQNHPAVVNHLLRSVEQMIVLSESPPLLVFKTKSSFAIFNAQIAQVFTWTQAEYVQLQSIVGTGSVVFVPSEDESLWHFDYTVGAQSAFFSLNHRTFAVTISDQQVTVFFCEQPLKISDFDFAKGTVLVLTELGEIETRVFVVKMTIPSNKQFCQTVAIEVDADGLRMEHSGNRLLVKCSGDSVLMLEGSYLFKINSPNPQLKSEFSIPLENGVKFLQSDRGAINVLTNNNTILSVDLKDKTSTAFHFPKGLTDQPLTDVLDGFTSLEHRLLVSSKAVLLVDKHNTSKLSEICFDGSILKVKMIKQVVVCLVASANTQSIAILNLTDDKLTLFDEVEEFTGVLDFEAFDCYLMVLYADNHLKWLSLSANEFYLSFCFDFEDFPNIVYDQMSTVKLENTKNVNSVTNLAINIPKIDRGLGDRVLRFVFFPFQLSQYLLLLLSDGSIQLYRCYFTSLVRVNIVLPLLLILPSSNSHIHCLTTDTFVIIRLTGGVLLKLSKKWNREVLTVLPVKQFRDFTTTAQFDLVFLTENSIEVSPVPTHSVTKSPLGGVVKSFIKVDNARFKDGHPFADLLLIQVVSERLEKLVVTTADGLVLYTLVFKADQRITTVQDISSAYSGKGLCVFIGYSVIDDKLADRHTKWQILNLEFTNDETVVCKANLLTDQNAQEKDRLISHCFNFGSVIFICLDDKLLRIEQNKLMRVYELNLINVKHVSLNGSSLLLADSTRNLSFFYWVSEKAELLEQSSYVLDHSIAQVQFLKETVMRVNSLVRCRYHQRVDLRVQLLPLQEEGL